MSNNKKKLILSLIFCIISVFLISCTNASKQEVLGQIEKGNYQQALEDMNNLNSFEREQVQNKALSKIQYIVQSVEDKTISYSEGVDELNFIKRIVPKKYEASVNKAIEQVKTLEQENNKNK